MKLSYSVGRYEHNDYLTIQSALDAVEALKTRKRVEILIENGTYDERLRIRPSNITLKGLGHVKIVGAHYAKMLDREGEPIGTFKTATVFVDGDGVCLENLEIVNEAGQGHIVGQAVALHVNGTEFISRKCKYHAYQDTVFVGPLPRASFEGAPFIVDGVQVQRKHVLAYFENDYIDGTVDFIFGGASAFFHQCQIHSRSQDRSLETDGYISATCTEAKTQFGMIFNECVLSADPDLKVFLGRPWRPFAHTVFQLCQLGRHIVPSGWEVWSNAHNIGDTRYYEYQNKSVNPPQRVAWSHELKDPVSLEDIFSLRMLKRIGNRL